MQNDPPSKIDPLCNFVPLCKFFFEQKYLSAKLTLCANLSLCNFYLKLNFKLKVDPKICHLKPGENLLKIFGNPESIESKKMLMKPYNINITATDKFKN